MSLSSCSVVGSVVICLVYHGFQQSYPQVIHRLILLIILLDTLEVEHCGG